MPVREFIVDPSSIDCDNVVADIEGIRAAIPQRGLMEQLTAIVYDDLERHLCVGYKDVTADEFWVSGHMPGMPVMPGIVMCEAAAQVFSYHVQRHDLSGVQVVGFGGLDNVRFRDVVRPGDRLLMACELQKFRRGRIVRCRFQGFVRNSLACEGQIIGVPLPVDALQTNSSES